MKSFFFYPVKTELDFWKLDPEKQVWYSGSQVKLWYVIWSLIHIFQWSSIKTSLFQKTHLFYTMFCKT